MDIKPIETIYNGYRFRSRLEARWAVFFDAANIRYQYEPEGFVGYLGIPYLPDFYLPDFCVYAEVKGSDKQLKEDIEKIDQAIDFNSTPISNGLVLLGEIPYTDNPELIPVFTLLYWDRGTVIEDCTFDYSHDKGALYRAQNDDGWYCYNLRPRGYLDLTYSNITFVRYIKQDYYDTTDFMECYKAARQARFEHGETPIIRR